jgi:hypothetical protein
MNIIPCNNLCFFIGYLMTLSIPELYIFNDRLINECETVRGMRIGRGNQSTWRKHVPVPLSPPQIPYDLTVGSDLGL